MDRFTLQGHLPSLPVAHGLSNPPTLETKCWPKAPHKHRGSSHTRPNFPHVTLSREQGPACLRGRGWSVRVLSSDPLAGGGFSWEVRRVPERSSQKLVPISHIQQ